MPCGFGGRIQLGLLSGVIFGRHGVIADRSNDRAVSGDNHRSERAPSTVLRIRREVDALAQERQVRLCRVGSTRCVHTNLCRDYSDSDFALVARFFAVM